MLWRDDKPDGGIADLIFCPSRTLKCRWRATRQIGMGTTLKRLNQLNRGPFTITGFGCDGSGAVISFGGGALEALKPACGSVRLALNPADNLSGQQLDLVEGVSGDREFSSQHPAMQAINPHIDSLGMDFSACGSGAAGAGPRCQSADPQRAAQTRVANVGKRGMLMVTAPKQEAH